MERTTLSYLYTAFDVYPSFKGAATHIFHMFSAGVEHFSGGTLVVLGTPHLPAYQEEEKFKIYRFRLEEENFLKRTEEFASRLHRLIESKKDWKLVHFRDIWGGEAVIHSKNRYKTLFEVNSLPSIELKFRYPDLSESILEKIRERENFLLHESDRIITPSLVTRDYLIQSRNLEPGKILHVPNGADPIPQYEKPSDMEGEYIIYFGAVQDWQGVDILLKAFSLLRDIENLRLLLCISGTEDSAKHLVRYAMKLDLEGSVVWKFGLRKDELYSYIQNATLSIVPLKEDDRNVVQGASPIKIFESMAAGTPILVSDLPLVREILTDRKTAKFVRPDRPMDLAVQIRYLLESPELRKFLAGEAKKLFLEKYTWDGIKIYLQDIYKNL